MTDTPTVGPTAEPLTVERLAQATELVQRRLEGCARAAKHSARGTGAGAFEKAMESELSFGIIELPLRLAMELLAAARFARQALSPAPGGSGDGLTNTPEIVAALQVDASGSLIPTSQLRALCAAIRSGS